MNLSALIFTPILLSYLKSEKCHTPTVKSDSDISTVLLKCEYENVMTVLTRS